MGWPIFGTSGESVIPPICLHFPWKLETTQEVGRVLEMAHQRREVPCVGASFVAFTNTPDNSCPDSYKSPRKKYFNVSLYDGKSHNCS